MQSLTQARDREFTSLCLRIIGRNNAAGRNSSILAVINEALAHQPRCHYIGFDYASRTLHRMERMGIEKALPAGPRRLRWLELQNQVEEAMNGPRKLPFDKALTFVLAFRRPSRFFIEPARAVRLLRPLVHYRLCVNI